jgi:F-type H+-transporting ATPase subunit epsilon
MAKLFKLTIITPERQFFDGYAEALTITAPDGEMTILADHVPIISPVVVGTIAVKTDGVWTNAFNSEGFMEVRHKEVVVFVQACERPEEIDAKRAEEALKRAEERLRQKQSISEYRQTKIALARAMARLRVTKSRH